MALLLCPTRVCAPRLTVRVPQPPAARLTARRSRATAVRASIAAAAGGAHEPNPVRADATCVNPCALDIFGSAGWPVWCDARSPARSSAARWGEGSPRQRGRGN
jgi:hypothetical protein